ncbi:hypothetical protein [Aequorivita xiaoshiensis]|nr:hypothetical protein [Aequorivita xiaoshiensis]
MLFILVLDERFNALLATQYWNPLNSLVPTAKTPDTITSSIEM